MALAISKKFNGLQESIGESITYQYVVFDATPQPDGNDQEFREALVNIIPRLENNIRLSGLSIDEQLNDTTWLITASYQLEKSSFAEQSSMTFDTGGSTVHKSNSIKLVDSGIWDGIAAYVQNPDKGTSQPVGFNGEDVEGVDIGIGGMVFTETHPIPDTMVTDAFRLKLFNSSWTVNDAPFRGYKAGEVLFKGANGSKNGVEKWSFAFNFEAIPNELNFTVAGATFNEKKGWDYVSVRYAKALSDDKTRIIVQPVQVDIHQMYRSSSFADLGIGVQSWEELTKTNAQKVDDILSPFGV